MRPHLTTTVLVLLAGSGFSQAQTALSLPQAQGTSSALQLAVPKTVHVDLLLAPPGATANSVAPTHGFDIDPDGLPVVARGATLLLMGAARPLVTVGTQPIGDFAWMHDGSLLLIIQGHLAGIGPHGLTLGPQTPVPGMEVRPAGKDDAYVFGGTSQKSRHDIFLFGRDGRIAKLLSAPAPVTAVAGDGTSTYVALGRSLLHLDAGHPIKPVMHTHSAVISLAMTSSGRLFYATKASVGYLTADGVAHDFLRGQGGLLRVHGDALFLLLRSQGRIIRFSPLEAFESLDNTTETKP